MATIELTSPAKGKMPGDTITVTDAEARWYLANGYARKDDDGDHRLDSSVEATADPTLAINREEPGTPPSSLTNEDTEDWSEQVAERFEFKGKAGKVKIVPGDPTTQVAAAEAVLDEDEDQPPASEVAQTTDPLEGEDLDERPEITSGDSEVKTTGRSRRGR